ncbi:MAG TPA: formate--tetrahydrofolate ligase [bacterium]|nr:formate--tetrahydrofolate ligase [bacterium]
MQRSAALLPGPTDEIRDIREVAASIGLTERDLDLHGRHRAKIARDTVEAACGTRTGPPRGKYVLVSAITPTPLGEGKTVTAIGLSMGLWRRGRTAAVAIRESTLGPTLGVKGGGAGGGASHIVPLDECLLGLGGDAHAVANANNLLAAFIDDALMRRSIPIDPFTVQWRRVVDISDRGLRRIVTGLGGHANGVPRETGFDITAASEVMALLALSRDARDLRARLGKIVAGFDGDRPVLADELRCAGAMAALLREAMQPNLMQTVEGTPAFIHTGPFGNISHGNSSIMADLVALPRVEYLVTEAGFGADMGAEKFFDIKCRASGLAPDAAVLVATVPGIKSHSGRYRLAEGRAVPAELWRENVPDLETGAANLTHQIRNLRAFGVPVVVAVNRYETDSPAELRAVRSLAADAGAVAVAEHWGFTQGGAGCVGLANAVEEACRLGAAVRPLYGLEDSPEAKIMTLATRLYGASDVSFTPEARRDLERYVKAGYGGLPVCIAKTHLSLSHDPSLKGAPSEYTFPIRGVRLAAGAGYLYAMAGDIMTMPGQPSHPHAAQIDVDAAGHVTGLV